VVGRPRLLGLDLGCAGLFGSGFAEYSVASLLRDSRRGAIRASRDWQAAEDRCFFFAAARCKRLPVSAHLTWLPVTVSFGGLSPSSLSQLSLNAMMLVSNSSQRPGGIAVRAWTMPKVAFWAISVHPSTSIRLHHHPLKESLGCLALSSTSCSILAVIFTDIFLSLA